MIDRNKKVIAVIYFLLLFAYLQISSVGKVSILIVEPRLPYDQNGRLILPDMGTEIILDKKEICPCNGLGDHTVGSHPNPWGAGGFQ